MKIRGEVGYLSNDRDVTVKKKSFKVEEKHFV